MIHKGFGARDGSVTLLKAGTRADGSPEGETAVREGRQTQSSSGGDAVREVSHTGRDARVPQRRVQPVSDRFFRQLFQSIRNGVLAVTPDGRLAVMNEVAFRILDLEPRRDAVGQPYAEVLR